MFRIFLNTSHCINSDTSFKNLNDCHLVEIMSLTTDIAAEKKDELSACNANYQECSLIVGVGLAEMKSG